MNRPEIRSANIEAQTKEIMLGEINLSQLEKNIGKKIEQWENDRLYGEKTEDSELHEVEKSIDAMITSICTAISSASNVSKEQDQKIKKINQQIEELLNQCTTFELEKEQYLEITNIHKKFRKSIDTLKKNTDGETKNEVVKPSIALALEARNLSEKWDKTSGAYIAVADARNPGADSRKNVEELDEAERDTDPGELRAKNNEGGNSQKETTRPPITIDLSKHYSRNEIPDFEHSSQGDAIPETAYKKSPAPTPSAKTPTVQPKSFFGRISNLARAAVLGITAFLGPSQPQGEKAPEAREQDRVTDTAETNKGDYQEMPPITRATEKGVAVESESLTKTYTLKPGDSFWRIAEGIIKNTGGNANDTTAVLKIVRELKKENPEVARRTWVGAILDISSANELARIRANELRGTYEESLTEETGAYFPVTPETNDDVRDKESQPSQEIQASADPVVGADANDQKEALNTKTVLEDKLTHPYLQRGETIWSRTHDMLLALGMKPNMAKRGVLGAIILSDSGMNETQAMRIKAEGSKNFDPAKHRLNFERAMQAAKELEAGKSPAEVAKKYGVTNVYEKVKSNRKAK